MESFYYIVIFDHLSILTLLNGSWKIAPRKFALIPTLILNQTLTLTGGNVPLRQFSGHPFKYFEWKLIWIEKEKLE